MPGDDVAAEAAMKQVVLVLAMAIAAAGCRTTLGDGPDYGYRYSGYQLTFDDGYGRRGHCPPGHRMKGWC
jgi:hypothetical protein